MSLDRRTFLISGAAALVGLAAAPARSQTIDQAKLMQPGPLGDMALGKDDAPATIVEYASSTCPHCAAFHATTFPLLKAQYIDTGKARFIFREFPFDDLALAAFMVARCAPKDKYFALIDVLFAQQKVWTARNSNPRDELLKIARFAGFTEEAFNKCLANEEVARGIHAVREHAEALGVKSTPTFFVGGKMLKGNEGIEKFKELLN